MSQELDQQEPQEQVEDGAIVTRMAGGDELALTILMQRYAGRLAVKAGRVLGSLATTEDLEEIVSDSFLQAWHLSNSYDPEKGPVIAWLTTITGYVSLDRRRSILRTLKIQRAVDKDYREKVVQSNTGSEAEERWLSVDLLQNVLKQMRQKSPNEVDLLLRIYVHGLTPAEVSKELGITPNATRVRLTRARKHLRKRLQINEKPEKGVS